MEDAFTSYLSGASRAERTTLAAMPRRPPGSSRRAAYDTIAGTGAYGDPAAPLQP